MLGIAVRLGEPRSRGRSRAPRLAVVPHVILTQSKFDSTGSTLRFSTYLGGSGTDEGLGLAVDSAGVAHVAGRTTSPTDFPLEEALQTTNSSTSNPSFDAFVARIAERGDSNRDGRVSPADVLKLQNSTGDDRRGDVNEDGKVDGEDVDNLIPRLFGSVD